jgi:hypothetical protein
LNGVQTTPERVADRRRAVADAVVVAIRVQGTADRIERALDFRAVVQTVAVGIRIVGIRSKLSSSSFGCRRARVVHRLVVHAVADVADPS